MVDVRVLADFFGFSLVASGFDCGILGVMGEKGGEQRRTLYISSFTRRSTAKREITSMDGDRIHPYFVVEMISVSGAFIKL
jgi:hypothetical protein